MASEKKKILVTSALPYANGSIHIGHLVEYIQTDIFVRFLKLCGERAIYCCADDTHGTPIEVNAAKQGISPEELIARYHKEHQEDFASFHIEFDNYYTTNSKENKEYADLFFTRLKEKGHIYTKEIEQTYCEHDKRFLPDRFVMGTCPKCNAKDQYGDVCEKCNSAYKTTDLVEPYCVLCKNTPVRKTSVHYFFKLSSFTPQLREFIENNKNLQKEVRNHVMVWIDNGLDDWDISRDGPYFGFKIPGENDKYYYVWLDAPIGYISSARHYCDTHGEVLDDYWKHGRVIHFIGKDIIYFHLLFWPAMLMGADFALPENVAVHGFLTVDGEKMSKSRGTFLTAKDFLKVANPELLRYYYASHLGRNSNDVNLDLNDFKSRANNELIANVANLFYRTLSFLEKNFNSKTSSSVDKKPLEAVMKHLEASKVHYAHLEFKEAVRNILEAAGVGNRYFQEKEPWCLIKTDKKKTHEVVTTCVTLCSWINTALKPILPVFTKEIEKQIGHQNTTWDELGTYLCNHTTGTSGIVLKKLEKDIKLPEGKSDEPTEQADVAGFDTLDLRVSEILEAKVHPNADKLLVLKIHLGSEKRQLVAGLQGHYTTDELPGKHIVVVSNLKPAKLRGIESQGMLLAATEKGTVALVLAQQSTPGDRVYLEGEQNKDTSKKQITIEQFQAVKLCAKNGKVSSDGAILRTEHEILSIDKNVQSGTVR